MMISTGRKKDRDFFDGPKIFTARSAPSLSSLTKVRDPGPLKFYFSAVSAVKYYVWAMVLSYLSSDRSGYIITNQQLKEING